MIAATGHVAQFLHIVLDDVGEGVVKSVVGLAHLEINVAVLHGGAQTGMLGIECLGTEGIQGVAVEQLAQFLVRDGFDLIDLV